MRVILTIEESTQGLWCICSGGVVLHDKLRFAPAIRLAHGLARKQHTSSGHVVRVEMICADSTILLAHYAYAVLPLHFAPYRDDNAKLIGAV